MFVDKKIIFESYFSDQLTFSNIHSRTSRRIYRLRTLLYLSGWMTHKCIDKYRHLVHWNWFSKLELDLEVRALPSRHH